MKKSKKLESEEWYKVGNDELNLAKKAFEDYNKFYNQVSFLCQQAVEKFLKGFLIENQIKPKKVHDLDFLLRQCVEIDKDFQKYKDSCRILTDYYIPSRYPIPWIKINKEQATKAIEIGEEIIKFIKSKKIKRGK